MNESDAIKKWCPFARENVRLNCGSTNRDDGKPIGMCIGSRCMAWRWQPGADRDGYCGLAGFDNSLVKGPTD